MAKSKQKLLHPITKKQFEYFKKCCHQWQKKLGVSDWCVIVRQDELGDDREAEVSLKSRDRQAIISIQKELPYEISDERLNKDACHEVLHIVLCLMSEQAEMAFSRQLVEAEEHAVVQRILNFIFV